MPVFFISAEQVRDHRITISGPLHHHLRTSLRYRAGDELWLADDRRRRYRARLLHVDARQLTAEVLEEDVGPPPQPYELVLAQALLKGERMDWVLQKATELGIQRCVPLVTGHTVVRPRPGRIEGQQERWQRIMLEAAQQSERWDIPSVEAPQEAMAFLRTCSLASNRFLLVEPGAGHLPREGLASVALALEGTGQIVLAVGPEGGWREEELQTAHACGFRSVTLGPRVLRAETATLAAVAVLQGRLGVLG